MKGDDKLILVIRLSKEQRMAIISHYPIEIIRKSVEDGIRNCADEIIEQDKIEGPSLLEKEK